VVPKPTRIQREGAQLQFRGTWSAGPGDDQVRFLADLRALRDSAAIGHDELAARAHYPSNILKEAENGPALPGLPILTAYVRACEGDVLDWEERWRRLNPEVAGDPGLPVRPAGASAAAVAGARAGVGVAPPDVYDPERVKAALRGDQARSEASRRAGDPGVSVPGGDRQESSAQDRHGDRGPSGDSWSAASSSWDAAADPGITSANGNHSAEHGARGPFDAAFSGNPDDAERSEPAQAEEFSWLKKSKPESPPADGEPAWRDQAGTGRSEPAGGGFGWSGQDDAGRAGQPAGSGFAWLERTDNALASPLEAEPAPPEPAVTERRPLYQADALTSQERTDFWSKPVPASPADPQRPSAAPRAEEPAIPRASWPAAEGTAATPAAEPAHRGVSEAAPAAAAQPLGPARPAAQAPASERDDRRKDRLFSARLLVVIVIAAIIGSALVLLLR